MVRHPFPRLSPRSNTAPAKILNLPETVCISLQGFSPIPPFFTGSSTPAFHWANDMLIDSQTGTVDLGGGGFDRPARTLRTAVLDVLTTTCAFPARNILFLGYGQGAMLPLYFAASNPDIILGGIVAIGARLPSSSYPTRKSKTPVLLCGGSRSREVTRSAVDALKASFEDTKYVKWEKPDDSMPANREEMLPIMQFFARRLQSRAGVPEGAVEV